MAKKGAQNGDWLHAPDVAMLRRLHWPPPGPGEAGVPGSRGPGAMEFIEAMESEVTISLAHTTADYDTAMEAFRLGARQVTHLFNAMPPLPTGLPAWWARPWTPRCAMWSSSVTACISIPLWCGRCSRCSAAKRVILISDTMRAAGMPDGDYTLGGQAVKVKGKYATLADGTMAGSVTDLMSCMKTAVSFGIPLADAGAESWGLGGGEGRGGEEGGGGGKWRSIPL